MNRSLHAFGPRIGPAKVDKQVCNVVQYIIDPRQNDGGLGDIMIFNIILVGILILISMSVGVLIGIYIGRSQILDEQDIDIRRILGDMEWDGQNEPISS